MLKRKVRRRRRRTRSRYGWKRQSGLGKALLYVAAVAVLFLVAVIIPVLFLIAYTAGEYGLAVAVLVIMYLGFAPALLIPYTWRFWSVPHQMSLASTLLRASICGVLFPIIVSLLMVLTWVVLTDLRCDDSGSVSGYVVAWIICFVLSFPLTAIGIVRAPLKQP